MRLAANGISKQEQEAHPQAVKDIVAFYQDVTKGEGEAAGGLNDDVWKKFTTANSDPSYENPVGRGSFINRAVLTLPANYRGPLLLRRGTRTRRSRVRGSAPRTSSPLLRARPHLPACPNSIALSRLATRRVRRRRLRPRSSARLRTGPLSNSLPDQVEPLRHRLARLSRPVSNRPRSQRKLRQTLCRRRSKPSRRARASGPPRQGRRRDRRRSRGRGSQRPRSRTRRS